MIAHLLAAIASALVFGVIVWQDGFQLSNDGRRYTGQWSHPPPFHRRFHHWTPRALRIATVLAFVVIGATFDDWRAAVMVATCSGAIFCASYLTVDAPAIALAWTAALAWHADGWWRALAIILTFASGVLHERGPVFAAVYAWHPILLIGLAGVAWDADTDPRDGDPYVGHPTIREAIKFHRDVKAQDLLDIKSVFIPLRSLVMAPAVFGAEPRTWAALALAYASRILGTDPGRFMWWAAPPLAYDFAHRGGYYIPIALALHIATMKRMP
jgi:hypothetical protein